MDEQVTFWSGGTGQRLGQYRMIWNTARTSFAFVDLGATVYFGSRQVVVNGNPPAVAVAVDRLGSNRTGGVDYFPYGQEKGSVSAGDRDKYTYYHDSGTDLSYADQRYYATGAGRFMTADPYRASGGPGDPGSWNRYAYVGGDPINFNDSEGLARCWVLSWHDNDEGRYALVKCNSDGGVFATEPGTHLKIGVYRLPEPGTLGETKDVITQAEQLYAAKDGDEWYGTLAVANRALTRIRTGRFSGNCLKALGNMGKRGLMNSGAALAIEGAFTALVENGFSSSRYREDFLRHPRLGAIVRVIGAPTIYLRSGADVVSPHREYFSGSILHEALHVAGFTDEDIRRGLVDSGFDQEYRGR